MLINQSTVLTVDTFRLADEWQLKQRNWEDKNSHELGLICLET